ncbi:hypothetical protein J6Y73_02110 [bacterium]|nr:hypothetical protein [bacterium]
MVKIFDLVKIFLGEMYRFGSKSNQKRKSNSKALLILLIILIPIYIYSFSINFSEVFSQYKTVVDNYDKVIYQIVVLVNISSLFFIILSGSRLSMTEKDNDVLGTLPIEEGKIVSAKLITAMILESFFEIFIGISGLIAYLISGGNDITVNGIIILLFAPLLSVILPTILFSFLIMVLKKAIQKSKFKRTFELFGLVLMIVFILGFSTLYSSMLSMDPLFLENTIIAYENILTYFPLLIFIKLAIQTGNIIYFLIYALILITLFIIFVLLFKRFAYRMMVFEKSTNQSSKKDLIEYKKKDLFGGFIKKEFGKLFSDNLYILNTLIMPIIMIVIAVVVSVSSDNLLIEDVESGITINLYWLIGPIMIMLISTMSLSSGFTLSLENKYVWIVKTLPINPKIIFRSKALFNLILYFIPSTIIYALFLIFGSPTLGIAIGTFLILLSSGFFTTYIYQWINLRHPAIDMEDHEIIKRSSSVMICSFIILGLFFLMPGSLFSLYILTSSYELATIFSGLLFFLLGLIFFLLVEKRGIKEYKNFV